MLVHIHPFQPRFSYDLVPSQRRTLPGSVSRSRPISKPPSAQSPFARHSSSLFRCDLFLHIRERYFPFFAHTDSCASPCTLPSPSALASSKGLCRLSPVPAGRWPFPTLSLQSLHRRLDPYPEMPLWCPCPFLPRELQPQPRCTHFGASSIPPQCNFNGDLVTGRQSFRYVQAPMVVSPPGCTYRAGSMSCGQPGRLRHAMDWKLPSRTVVSLHDRNGQLSWRVFHPLDCSLVGCSLQR